jgi:peptidoglycan/xylan/chitin deacetylase (PgdA/CDA1 family)
MFHYVLGDRDNRFPNLRGVSLAQFREFLDWVTARGEVVHPKAFLESVVHGTPLPLNAHLLTFDDGLQDHYRWVFPELERRGLSGLFFVTSGSLGGERLLRVHKIHALYGMNGYAWLQQEFAAAAENALGRSPDVSFADPRAKTAYPYDDDVTAGFKYAINYLMAPHEVNAVLDQIIAASFDERLLTRQFYMSSEQLREMSQAGMQFGFHGHTHTPFSQLTLIELAAEMDASAAAFGALLPNRPACVSYPYGDASSITEEHVAMLQRWGVEAAFMAESSTPPNSALHLPRVDIAQWQRGLVT